MSRFRALAEQLRAELPRRDVILDGEVVALDDDGRINFLDLMRRRGTLAYAAFDVNQVSSAFVARGFAKYRGLTAQTGANLEQRC